MNWKWTENTKRRCTICGMEVLVFVGSSNLLIVSKWVDLKIVYPYTQWLMIIIPCKWL